MSTESSQIKPENGYRASDPPSTNSNSEVERLRSHLLEMEQMHTEELLEMQQRIDQLQQEVETERSKLLANESHPADKDALGAFDLKCQELQIENRQLDEKVTELSRLLDGYEAAKQSEIDMAVGRLQNELQTTQSSLQTIRQELVEAQTQHCDLQTLLMVKQRELDALNSQLHALNAVKATETVQSPSLPGANAENVVDKHVLRSLLLQYFSPSSVEHAARRVEVLALLTKILDFSTDERAAIGLTIDPITGKWNRKPSIRPGMDHNSGVDGDSLADKWISFLLNEAKQKQNDENSVDNLS